MGIGNRFANSAVQRAAVTATALAAVFICAPVSLAALELNVTRVGFPTVRDGQVVRYGTWTPVIVDLALVGEASFDGSLRIDQYDVDGDQCFDQVGVHLRAETGGSQRYYLYMVANPAQQRSRFAVEVLDEEGETVEVISQGEPTRRALPAQQPSNINHDDLLLLSISDAAIDRIKDLVELDESRLYERELRVGHMSPADLPELWIGLEAVDFIVWDDAHPENLSVKQIDALVEWVHQGGTLLIGASRSAGAIVMTEELDRLLPVDLGEVAMVDDLPQMRNRLLEVSDGSGFRTQVPVVRCKLREGAQAISRGSGVEEALLSRRRVDRGHVIFCGVTLKDLFSGDTGRPVQFFRTLFQLRTIDGADSRPDGLYLLFGKVAGIVSFATRAGLYLFLAGTFSVAYLLAATLGTWWFLGTRGWRRHAWTGFGFVAIVSGLLSVTVVKALQGFGEQLHQLTIVDAEAGEHFGYATGLFGLKTSSDKAVDVWLPSDPTRVDEPGPTGCSLRPIPPGNDALTAGSHFVDPGEYRLVPGSALVEDVRIRATLKQFEGRWKGPIDGKVTGKISIRRTRMPVTLEQEFGTTNKPELKNLAFEWRITDDSFIINDLGVDLKKCYLVYSTLNMEDRVGSRGDAIFALPIGTIPSNGMKAYPAATAYALTGNQTLPEKLKDQLLAEQQKVWSRPFHPWVRTLGYGDAPTSEFRLGEEQNALLLLSTLGEYDPRTDQNMAGRMMGVSTWSRDRLRQLDLRDHLTRDCVYLLGFADDAGPVRMYMREGKRAFRELKPDAYQSRTMYRIRIPADFEGKATAPTEESHEDKPH